MILIINMCRVNYISLLYRSEGKGHIEGSQGVYYIVGLYSITGKMSQEMKVFFKNEVILKIFKVDIRGIYSIHSTVVYFLL